MLSTRWLLAGLVLHLLLQFAPAWQRVRSAPSGRDYASYYYAVHVAARGGDPYDTAGLSATALKERTRKYVHPYFYPPPFLLGMTWALPLSLKQAYVWMLALNELLLFGSLAVLVRAFGVAPPIVALLLATYTPIPDNAWMGQANLMALFPALLGLALVRQRPGVAGVLVGVAGMLKMSPALFLLSWALERRWRAVGAAVGTAVLLSLLCLPLVGLPEQIGFYLDVLPGFAAGDYHGLTVPISLPANHSVPDLFNRWWPGTSETRLSEPAQWAAKLAAAVLLSIWAWRFHREPAAPERTGAGLGVLTVWMVLLPAYTYEHHLVFLLLPVGLAGTAALGTRRPGPILVFVVAYFFLAWPLAWLNDAREALPALDTPIRESKFVAALMMVVLLSWRVRPAVEPEARSAPPIPGAASTS